MTALLTAQSLSLLDLLRLQAHGLYVRMEVTHRMLMVIVDLPLLHLLAYLKSSLLLAEKLSPFLFPRFLGLFPLLLHFFLLFDIGDNFVLTLLVQLVLVVHDLHHAGGVERAIVGGAHS